MKKYIIKTLILILIAIHALKAQDLSHKPYDTGLQAYKKFDYLSAAIYWYAYAQREPAQMKDKKFSGQLNTCFIKAFGSLSFGYNWYIQNSRECELCKMNLQRSKNGQNSDVVVTSVGIILTTGGAQPLPPELPIVEKKMLETFTLNRDWFGIAYWVASSKYYNKPHVIFFKNAAATTSPIPNLTRIIIPLETEEDKSSVMIMLDGSKRYYGKMAFMNNPDMQSSCTLTGYVEQNEAETIFIVN
jgi:hypothetical protein